jgi:hypothetical protein
MGQVCSSGAVAKQVTVARDPEDQELDEVEMKETQIPDFDSFFERAAAPLNEMVEIHNGIYLSDENLKQAAAAMQGETQLRLVVANSGGSVTLEFWRFDDQENEEVLSPEQLNEKLLASAPLKAAYDKTKFAVDQLNESLADGGSGTSSQLVVKRGRLLVTATGAQDALVRSVNIALFSLRKELAKLAHVTSLCEAVRVFFGEVAKTEDISSLNVKTADSGAVKLYAGDREFDLKKLDKLSKPTVQFRDALVDLLENVETAATSVPELVEQSNAFATEAQEFPAKVPEAAKSADLGFSEVPKALLATTSNVKALGNGPHIAKSTTAMIQYAGRELAQALSKPAGV